MSVQKLRDKSNVLALTQLQSLTVDTSSNMKGVRLGFGVICLNHNLLCIIYNTYISKKITDYTDNDINFKSFVKSYLSSFAKKRNNL